jgi:hypothetical protein
MKNACLVTAHAFANAVTRRVLSENASESGNNPRCISTRHSSGGIPAKTVEIRGIYD